MTPSLHRALGTLLAGAMLCTVTGAEASDAETFLERSEEGWFWYEPSPPDPEEPVLAPPPPPTPTYPATVPSAPQAPPPAAEETRAAPSPPPGPAPLSAEWFRENLQGYMDRAIDEPTPENVRAYTYLERIAGLKAAAFARAKADVTLGNPYLDVTTERPLATFGAQALDREAFDARQRLITGLAETLGLLFFFSSECGLCEAQAYVLRNMADKHGLPVMAVSLDGRPLENDYLDGAWRPDRGQAAQLGVTRGPALFLMRPPEDIVSLGHGAMDIAMIEKRLVRAAHLSGWITEAAYLETEPVRRRTRDVRLPDIPPEVMAEPGRLADFLETLIAR